MSNESNNHHYYSKTQEGLDSNPSKFTFNFMNNNLTLFISYKLSRLIWRTYLNY